MNHEIFYFGDLLGTLFCLIMLGCVALITERVETRIWRHAIVRYTKQEKPSSQQLWALRRQLRKERSGIEHEALRFVMRKEALLA